MLCKFQHAKACLKDGPVLPVFFFSLTDCGKTHLKDLPLHESSDCRLIFVFVFLFVFTGCFMMFVPMTKDNKF